MSGVACRAAAITAACFACLASRRSGSGRRRLLLSSGAICVVRYELYDPTATVSSRPCEWAEGPTKPITPCARESVLLLLPFPPFLPPSPSQFQFLPRRRRRPGVRHPAAAVRLARCSIFPVHGPGRCCLLPTLVSPTSIHHSHVKELTQPTIIGRSIHLLWAGAYR